MVSVIGCGTGNGQKWFRCCLGREAGRGRVGMAGVGQAGSGQNKSPAKAVCMPLEEITSSGNIGNPSLSIADPWPKVCIHGKVDSISSP